MRQICRYFLGLLLTASVAGCAVMSAADVAVLVMTLPVPVQTGTVKLSGYSLKPASSEDATELILEAIPPDEGNVHFTGRVEWTGLRRLKQPVGALNQSMGAITDSNILFLWWNKAIERYEILIRLPFTEIYSIELWTPGFGTAIRFCHEMDEIPVGGEVLKIDRQSTLRIMKPGVFIDAEKTREVFVLLDTQLGKKTESPGLPDPCDESPASNEEHPGFGESDSM
jgi:hypothetical protein